MAKDERARHVENLSERLSGVFDRLTKQGALSEDDVKTALREVRVALLEADVSLPIARFCESRQESNRSSGNEIGHTGPQVIKIVHDELVHVLTGDTDPGVLKVDNPPAPILMVGWALVKRQPPPNWPTPKRERGQTCSYGVLGRQPPRRDGTLQILGAQIIVDTLPTVSEDPVAIAKRAKTQASLGGYDVYMLDTAGRLHIDQELIAQAAACAM